MNDNIRHAFSSNESLMRLLKNIYYRNRQRGNWTFSQAKVYVWSIFFSPSYWQVFEDLWFIFFVISFSFLMLINVFEVGYFFLPILVFAPKPLSIRCLCFGRKTLEESLDRNLMNRLGRAFLIIFSKIIIKEFHTRMT